MKFSSKQISEQDLTYRVISGELLNLYPDIIPKVVSLSELQEAGQDDENKGPKERIIHLKDLADVSESEKKVLSYFETARKLGASDIHF